MTTSMTSDDNNADLDLDSLLEFKILPQPNDSTCGPTCLHAIYHYYGDDVPLEQVIEEHKSLKEGGTLAVFLACHALRRGYQATIYTYNLSMFDPSWFSPEKKDLVERLQAQLKIKFKNSPRFQSATHGYLEFLQTGGILKTEVLNAGLIRRYLKNGIPILTGLSATYLYQVPREVVEYEGAEGEYDDLRGEPSGHFVVLCGYKKEARLVTAADPLLPNPMAPSHQYDVKIDRVIGAILLGVITHDANLLIIEPKKVDKVARHVHTDRRQ